MPTERPDRIGVLFVCLGNICRSPLAECVFRALVDEAGLAHAFDIDSAGTASYHVGDQPDPRTRRTAAERGVTLTGRARQVEATDFRRFDYIIAMDADNHRTLERRLARLSAGDERRGQLRMLREFDPEAGRDLDVPDPYYGGPRGFHDVHDIVERSCLALLGKIRIEHGLAGG